MTILREASREANNEFDAEALIEEARVRQRTRRRFISIAMIITVLVGILVTHIVGGGGARNHGAPSTSSKGQPSRITTSKAPQKVLATNTVAEVPLNSVVGVADSSIGYAIGWGEGPPGDFGGLQLTFDGGHTWVERPMPANTPGNSGYAPKLVAFGSNDLWMTMGDLHVPSIDSATDFG